MTLGTSDKKKVGALAVLGIFALYMVYANLLAGPDIPAGSPAAPAVAAAPAAGGSVSRGLPGAKTSPRGRPRSEEFHPAIKRKQRENQLLDPETIDPTLRIDLLKKVQAVELAGTAGVRNVFQYGSPPALAKADLPKGPEPKVFVPYGPKVPPPPPPKPPEPPPPPIPLKYYAFWIAMDTGKKTACFLDNEDILMAAEGETVKRRYRVIQINAKSVVMEDLDVKKQQTLPLTEEAAQGG